MVTKIYRLNKRYAAYFETKYCGVVVPMVFTLGMGSDPEQRAEFITTDRFTQDAVEHDPRFGKAFFLAETYGTPAAETPEEKPTEAKAVAKKSSKKKAVKATEIASEQKVFATMNDAIYYLEEELGLETTDENLEALMAANNVIVKA